MVRKSIRMLDTEAHISPTQVNDYQENGVVLIPGLLPDVSDYREIIASTTESMNTEDRPLDERDTYGKAFLQTMNLWTVDEQVRTFVFARRFAAAAAQLMNVEHVRLYHDQSLFKEPGGGHTPWHQDQYYWPLDTNQTITMWMPLVDIRADMGLIEFAMGSHKRRKDELEAISDGSDTLYEDIIDQEGYRIWNPGPMKAGDVTFHAGWTIHRAGPNISDTCREVMTIIYFADGANISKPGNSFQEDDRMAWLGGLEPGNPAVSDLNPLLY